MTRLVKTILATFLLLFLLAESNARSSHQKPPLRAVTTAGEDLRLSCDVEPDLGGLIVWKHGARVLFAGDLRIKRDERLAVREGR